MPTATTRCSWAHAVIAESLLRDCAHSLLRARPAAGQLRDYGVKGVVMLDLSLAADIHQLVWLPRDEAYDAAHSAKTRLRAVARRLGEVVNQDYNTSGAVLQNRVGDLSPCADVLLD